jgi:hypothetical protein
MAIPANRHRRVNAVWGQATTAEVNAGKTILESSGGRSLAIVDGWLRAIGGAAATCTYVDIRDVGGTTNYMRGAQASLTQNTVLRLIGTADGLAEVTPGKGLKIASTTNNLATATHIDYYVEYVAV